MPPAAALAQAAGLGKVHGATAGLPEVLKAANLAFKAAWEAHRLRLPEALFGRPTGDQAAGECGARRRRRTRRKAPGLAALNVLNRHKQWMEAGRRAEAGCDLEGAILAFTEAEAQAKNRRERALALAHLSKQYSDLAWNAFAKANGREFAPHAVPPPASVEEGAAFARKAMDLSERACELAPTDPVCCFAKCANYGKLALYQDVRTMVHMSNQVKANAERTIALDPTYEWGHHSLGRWNDTMASLPAWTKPIVAFVFRGEVFCASHAKARENYEMAKRINPTSPNHRVMLAKALRNLGEERAALQELEEGLHLPMADANDFIVVEQGRQLQRELLKERREKYV